MDYECECGRKTSNCDENYVVTCLCGKPMKPLKAKTEPVVNFQCSAVLSCDCCGGKMVYIRGRHPGMDNRLVCPTCMAETLDDIKGRLRTDYGQAMQEAR